MTATRDESPDPNQDQRIWERYLAATGRLRHLRAFCAEHGHEWIFDHITDDDAEVYTCDTCHDLYVRPPAPRPPQGAPDAAET